MKWKNAVTMSDVNKQFRFQRIGRLPGLLSTVVALLLVTAAVAAAPLYLPYHPAIFPEAGETLAIEGDHEYRLDPQHRVLINIGSVGQPRDGDTRASFVVVEEGRVLHKRVAYPFEKTMAKIRSHPELDDWLAERLALGK